MSLKRTNFFRILASGDPPLPLFYIAVSFPVNCVAEFFSWISEVTKPWVEC